MKTGARYCSSVCSTEVIIIHVPSSEGQLSCGSAAMALAGEDLPETAPLSEAQEGAAAMGKRYVDQETGLEVLCAKVGLGALAFEGRALELKTAAPLPASD